MIKALLPLLIALLVVSCGSLNNFRIFKSEITVEEAIRKKEQMDKSDNPAFKYSISESLKKKLIKVNDVVVMDIAASGNIDYNFCVIVSAPSVKGDIECYVYTKKGFYLKEEDIDTMSELIKGSTKIDIIGEFSRFFSLLDETYTKIEIINAEIEIKED